MLENRIKAGQENSQEFNRFMFRAIKNWSWFVIALSISMIVVYLIDRYTTRVYPVNASILIRENPNEMGGSAVELLYGNQVFANSRNLTNESIILKSTPLIRATINELGFNKSFYAEGNMKISEVYGDLPINIVFDSTSSRIPYYKTFQISLEDNETFKVFVENKNESVSINGAHKFGEKINYNSFEFTVIKTQKFEYSQLSNTVFLFKVVDIEKLTKEYQSKLIVKPVTRESSILELSIKGNIPQKEINFLSKLMEIFIDRGLEEKNRNATKTIEFIDEQLGLISDSLSFTEDKLELFKESNSTLDISEEASRLYGQLTEMEGQKVQHAIEKNYYEYLEKYFETDSEDSFDDLIIPSNFGINDPVLNALIAEIVSLQIEMNQVLVEGKTKNPFQNMLHQRKNDLKMKALENISTLKERSQINIKNIDNRIDQVEVSLRRLPKQERSFIDIKRIYDFNEKLYLLLMEKRAEAAISKASTTSDVIIVNPPQLAGGPIQPQTRRNLIIGIFLGFLIPLIIIYLREYFNTKILYKEDIDQLTDIPFLGVIGHKKYKDNLVVKSNPKSAVAESFRSIRSNIEYFAADKTNKLVMITSSISSEGKTFCAINLASVFALSGKKTVLIGADMRKPKLYYDFDTVNQKGLSSFLIKDATLKEILQPTDMDTLDIITSGPLPPNPSELLMRPEFDDLIDQLKKEYHYIVLDTPPIGLVTDAIILKICRSCDLHCETKLYAKRHD